MRCARAIRSVRIRLVDVVERNALTQFLPSQSESTASPRLQRWGRRWAQGITLAIVVNLTLVLFNLTYVPLRQIYLRYLPVVVRTYDPVKRIEPHPITQKYLAEITNARSQISQHGLQSTEAQTALADLRAQSQVLLEENPFLTSGQVALFGRLKRRMQIFTGADSTQAAFNQFWQADYLSQRGWQRSNEFLRDRIEPLLAQTYFRETLPTGQYIDEFWRIDLVFILFFGGELLLRTLIISRYRQGVSWGAAIARRWYEIPLVLPFWRWLRIIPAAIRLHRTKLLDVEDLIGQVTHEPAAYLSDRVSKFVMVRLINQTQTSVKEGKLLSSWQSQAAMTTVGDPEKLDQITDRLVQLIVMRVMPTVKPDLEQLLRHSLHRAMSTSELYDGLRQIPGFDTVPGGALNSVSDYLAQATCDILADSYTDQQGRVLLDQLSYDFRHALGSELQSDSNSEELQRLLSDLLEELKINYVQRSEQYDPEATLQEVDTLHQTVQSDKSSVQSDKSS